MSAIDEYDLINAMYGKDCLSVYIDNRFPNKQYTSHVFGGDSQCQKNKLTTTSAIAILKNGKLDIYHNIFSRNSLPLESLRIKNIRHFAIDKESYFSNRAYQGWQEI